MKSQRSLETFGRHRQASRRQLGAELVWHSRSRARHTGFCQNEGIGTRDVLSPAKGSRVRFGTGFERLPTRQSPEKWAVAVRRNRLCFALALHASDRTAKGTRT